MAIAYIILESIGALCWLGLAIYGYRCKVAYLWCLVIAGVYFAAALITTLITVCIGG